jgi:4-hydroxy-2-oxoheptanedioate aldolase
MRIGAWSMVPDALVVESLGRSGVDWVGLDMQHGTYDVTSAARAIQLLDAMRTPAYVRVAQNELHLIPHVADAGASAVIVAMVDSPTLAERAVLEARFQPSGNRSYGGRRYGLTEVDDRRLVEPAVFAMIESRAGVDCCEQIAEVDGIAGLHVGPVDLGLALGLGLDRDHPIWREAIDRICAAAHAVGRTATMHAVTANTVDQWRQAHFDEIIIPADISLLQRALETELESIRGPHVGPE